MKLLVLDTNIPPIYAKSIEEFNSYVEKYKTENEIILTKGMNISQKNLRNMPCSKVWKRGNRFEFQYIDAKQQIRVIYSTYNEKEEADPTISHKALDYFKGILDVIPDDDHEEDSEIFTCPENTVSTYYNYVNERYTNIKIEHTYSLDRNSAFLASMLKIYPETKPWVDKYYRDKLNGIQEIKSYDKILIGWLKNPSKHRSHAWKKIINDSNRTIHQLRKELEDKDYTVLLVNTDAVKFIDKYDYPVSRALGDFKYEWQDCEMYIKGVKSYMYKEKGRWIPKQAGQCKLDKIKSRDEWTLEDFISSDTIKVRKIRKNKFNLLEEYYE